MQCHWLLIAVFLGAVSGIGSAQEVLVPVEGGQCFVDETTGFVGVCHWNHAAVTQPSPAPKPAPVPQAAIPQKNLTVHLGQLRTHKFQSVPNWYFDTNQQTLKSTPPRSADKLKLNNSQTHPSTSHPLQPQVATHPTTAAQRPPAFNTHVSITKLVPPAPKTAAPVVAPIAPPKPCNLKVCAGAAN
jgi:hypothetical protein